MSIITTVELLERWTNVERVLVDMPEHERKKHWDMSQWGAQTSCGTIACAAGHCGLDPWFRERGFTLNFDENGESDISNVEEFFGHAGTNRIFLNTQRRSVDKVVGEVREYIAELRKIESLRVQYSLPHVGAALPEHGGIFAGIRLGSDGEQDLVLIAGPEHAGYTTWKAAMNWAAGLDIAGHKDFVLPDRRDGTALFGQARNLFATTWYWLSEQHADLSDGAWIQLFYDGYQGWHVKDYDDRARAVRRVPIQSFNNSVISGAAA